MPRPAEPRMIYAPFTAKQVEMLNAEQERADLHGYTCKNSHELVATINGWVCPRCSYTQEWAWNPENTPPRFS